MNLQFKSQTIDLTFTQKHEIIILKKNYLNYVREAHMSRTTNNTEKRNSNQATSKLLHLLSIITSARVPLRLQEITAQAQMPQATTLRYLNGLIEDGYVFQEEDSLRYMPTWRLCKMGDQIKNHLSIRTMSGTLVSDLSVQLSLGACLVIEQNYQCIYLDCVDMPTRLGGTLTRIGKKTPLHTTGSGKLFLSRYTDQELDKLIDTIGLDRLTDNTITDKQALLRELECVRTQGYAVDNEECEPNLRCVSAPVYSYDEIIYAAISVFGPVDAMSPEAVNGQILPALRQAARTLSVRLGSKIELHPTL